MGVVDDKEAERACGNFVARAESARPQAKGKQRAGAQSLQGVAAGQGELQVGVIHVSFPPQFSLLSKQSLPEIILRACLRRSVLQYAAVTNESNPPKPRGCVFYGCLSLA